MTPPVARAAGRVQVALAVGTFPTAIVSGLLALPFGWETSLVVGITVMVSAMSLSALFVPFFGLVLSWMGLGRGRE